MKWGGAQWGGGAMGGGGTLYALTLHTPPRQTDRHNKKGGTAVTGPPFEFVGGGGAALVFALPFLFISQGRQKSLFLFFPPQDRLYFHHASWPFSFFTHFFHNNICLKKTPPPPPNILMVAP